MPPKQSLGKGLGAIFPDLLGDVKERSAYVTCGIEELSPNKYQPRKDFNDKELRSLVDSIKKSGIIQPIVVRRVGAGYEIITGERRWRAAQEAGLKNVPIIIRDAQDLDVAEWSLIENIQRQDLNPIEEGEAYQTLSDKFGLSQEEIATRVGKDRTTVTNAIRLLKLPAEVKTYLIDKKITAGHARALLTCNSLKEQLQLSKAIIQKKLNVRQTESLVDNIKKVAMGKKTQKKEAYIADLEKTLASRLKTAVKITNHKKRGRIELHFSSNEELDRLVTLLLKTEN